MLFWSLEIGLCNNKFTLPFVAFGIDKNFFARTFLCSPRLHLFDQNSKTSNIVLLQINNVIYSCDGKADLVLKKH